MNTERPAIVIDCSQAQQLNVSGVYLLLCCLEEAMKRNGDVRLAVLSAQAYEALRLAGGERLFCIFETVESARESYRRRAPFMAPQVEADSAMVSEHLA